MLKGETIISLRRKGFRPKDISTLLGVSRSTVAGVIHRAGLSVEAKGRNAITEEFKKAVILSSGTIREISEEWKVSDGAIRRWRKKFAAEAQLGE